MVIKCGENEISIKTMIVHDNAQYTTISEFDLSYESILISKSLLDVNTYHDD